MDSRRGAEGGYLLARPADSLTVGDVLRFVEGPRTRLGSSKARPRQGGQSARANPFSEMWEQVDRAVSEILDKTTLADILRSWSEKQNRFVLNWEI